MTNPAPIDRDTLPSESENAVKCWRFNIYRALEFLTTSVVFPVWATRTTVYSARPDEGRSRASGSRSDDPLYATEADAWAACIAEFKRWCDERLNKLEEMAAKAGEETNESS